MKKNKKIYLIITFILLIISLGFFSYIKDYNESKKYVSNYDFNKKNNSYYKSLPILYSIVDEDKIDNKVTTLNYLNEYKDSFLFAINNDIKLEKQGDFYVGKLKYQNSSILSNIVDYTFTETNIDGITVNGCKFDKKNLIVKIPKKYYNETSKKVDNPIQMQLLVSMKKNKLDNLNIDINITGKINKKRNVSVIGSDLDTLITITDYKKGKNIIKDDINVTINDSGEYLNPKLYNWNAIAGTLELNISPILIQKVDVHIRDKGIVSNVISSLTSVAKAVTYAKMNIAGQLTNQPTVAANDVITFFDVPIAYKAGDGVVYGDSNLKTKFYEYSSEYSYYSCSNGDCTPTNSQDYFLVDLGSDNGGHTNLNDLGKNLYRPEHLYVKLYCGNHAAEWQSSSNSKMKFSVKVLEKDTTNNRLILQITTSQNFFTQLPEGVIKLVWENSEGRIKVKKYLYGNGVRDQNTCKNGTFAISIFDNEDDCIDKSNAIQTKATNDNCNVNFKRLEFGQYWVRETECDSNLYTCDNSCHKVTLNKNDLAVSTDSDDNEKAYIDTSLHYKLVDGKHKIPSNPVVNYKKYVCLKVSKKSTVVGSDLSGITFQTAYGGVAPILETKTTTASATSLAFGPYEKKSGQSIYFRELDTNSSHYNNHGNWALANVSEATYTNNASVVAVYDSDNTGKYLASCPNPADNEATDVHRKYCLKVIKKDTAGSILTADYATFQLCSDVSCSNVISTQNTVNGVATFMGLTHNGSTSHYYVKEIKAPAGYSINELSPREITTNAYELPELKVNSTNPDDCGFNPESIVFVNGKAFLNFFKMNSNGKAIDSALFVVQKISDGSFLYFSTNQSPVKESVSDFVGVTKQCYTVKGYQNGISIEGNNLANNGDYAITTTGGEACISGLEEGEKYRVYEVKPAKYHTFSDSTYKDITAYNIFTTLPEPSTISNSTFINIQTNYVFKKAVSSGSSTYTNYVLRQIPFEVKDSNGNVIAFKKLKSGQYVPLAYTLEYASVISDQLEESGIVYTALNIDNNYNEINIVNLPVGKYSIKEVETGGCGESCTTCNGFYYPDYSDPESYEFTINEDGTISGTKQLINIPTEIEFTKKDFYNYYNASTPVQFENGEERNAFDNITFNLMKNGVAVDLVKVEDHGNCATDDSYSLYRYVPSNFRNYYNSINTGVSYTTDLHTCGGHIKIQDLCRDTTYTMEEVSLPSNSVFTLPSPLPSVNFIIPKTYDSTVETATKKTIENEPNQYEIIKADYVSNDLINDRTALFNVYQCSESVIKCTSLNGTLLSFGTTYDYNDGNPIWPYVYKYTNGSQTNLRLTDGKIYLRYLPKGYKYAIEEIQTPTKFIQLDENEKYIQLDENPKIIYNKPISITLTKNDMYGYYNSNDKIALDNNEKLLDTAKFVLRDKDGHILTLHSTSTQGVYKYDPESEDTGIQRISTKDGTLKILYLPKGNDKVYYIEEVETTSPTNFILRTDIPAPSDKPAAWTWLGHPYVKYILNDTTVSNINTDLSNLISNKPTRIEINKVNDERPSKIIKDPDTTFNVYMCNKNEDNCNTTTGILLKFETRGVIAGDNEDPGVEVYKYSKLNQGSVIDLHPVEGRLILRYLPADKKYILVETKGPKGYYAPALNSTAEFEIFDFTAIGPIKNVINTPVYIDFIKEDLYNLYKGTDTITYSEEEVPIFDKNTFKLLDLTTNEYLSFELNTSTCSGLSGYNEYKVSTESGSSQELHTCGGTLRIRGIEGGKSYKLVETAVPEDSLFIFNPDDPPSITYTIPVTVDGATEDVIKKDIFNDATRVELVKRSSVSNDPIDDEETTFKLYKCDKNVTECTQSNGTIVRFMPRQVIETTSGKLDADKEVYVALNGSKLTNTTTACSATNTSNCYVEELHPFQGSIILRYLQLNYKYVAVETNAPRGHYLPTSDSLKNVSINVSSISLNTTKSQFNYLTRINLIKDDIYKYYSNSDQAKLESDEKLLDTAKFSLRDNNGYIVSLHKTSTDGIYEYNPNITTNLLTKISTYNGTLSIIGLNRGTTYYIEEVESTDPMNFVIPTNVEKPLDLPNYWRLNWQGHPYVKYTIPANIDTITYESETQTISNTPTRVKFVKVEKVGTTTTLINDETTTFRVYQCKEGYENNCHPADGIDTNKMTLINFSSREKIGGTDTSIVDNEDTGKEVYKYSKLNASGVVDLHPYRGELILRYLPAGYKYVLLETVAPTNYLLPSGRNRETPFEVKEEMDETFKTELTSEVQNTPTEIIFKKSDFYNYYNENDIKEAGSIEKLLDTAMFTLRDKDGNYLSTELVRTDEEIGNIYKCGYTSGTIVPIKTHNGVLKITHLTKGETYYIEEISSTNPYNFILPTNLVYEGANAIPFQNNGHPVVRYYLPEDADESMSTITQEIKNKPTRIAFKKIDNNGNVILSETTTFEVYQCIGNVECHPSAGYDPLTMKLINFVDKAFLANDEEDYNKKVYKYSKLNTNGVTSLHPYNGELILRYLPAKENNHTIKYVLLETESPNGYYLPEGEARETPFEVSDNSSGSFIGIYREITNNPTEIVFKKSDIYNYYTPEDYADANERARLLDTAKFVIYNSLGQKLKLNFVGSTEHGNIYSYDSVAEGEDFTRFSTNNGLLRITNLMKNSTYYIEEYESTDPGNFVIPTDMHYNGLPFENNGHPVVQYDLPATAPANMITLTREIENSPTRVKFQKVNEKTQLPIDDESATFNVYQCVKGQESNCKLSNINNPLIATKISFTERGRLIEGDTESDPYSLENNSYKYAKLNNGSVTDLHPYQGEILIYYLPSDYKYLLVETVAPKGYYLPTGEDAVTPFIVSGEKNQYYTELTSSIDNTPTEIIFKKSDFYKFYNESDVKDENSLEKLLDTAKFVLRDSNGVILKLKLTDTNDGEGNVYYYSDEPTDDYIERISTHLGYLKITNLERGKTYYIEEIETTNPKIFILPNNMIYEGLPFRNYGHPVVQYILPLNAPADVLTVTREIENKPTRVKFEKRDSKYGYLIDDETTTFRIYQCKEGHEDDCHPSDGIDLDKMTLMKFEPRSILENDEEDPTDNAGLAGVEVYKHSKLNNGTITDLHPYHGLLVLRYLTPGYKYVLYETVAPKNYSLPFGKNRETEFTVKDDTVDVDEVDVPNKPTSIVLRKYDEKGNLLTGAKFKVYEKTFNEGESKTCDLNINAIDQPKRLLGLKTVYDGIYEAKPVLDTHVITTCTDTEQYKCNELSSTLVNSKYTNSWMGLTDTGELKSPDNIELLINEETNESESYTQIQEGEALIQYLEYGHCYIFEEIEPPKGYSLPEDEKDRWTMVNIAENDTYDHSTFKTLINMPTPYQFYKYDEFNQLLDGAKFKLQKLNSEKVYEDVTVTEDVDKEYELSGIEKPQESTNDDNSQEPTGDNTDEQETTDDSEETQKVSYKVYKVDKNSENTTIETIQGTAMIYYLEPGQYRILEVEPAPGKELGKNPNVATFFVTKQGMVYGNRIISNKEKTKKYQRIMSDSAELIVTTQTGQNKIRYGLIISAILVIISILVIFNRKRKEEK